MKHKEDIIKLIKEGNSINRIKEKLGCSKGTIYHHYKRIKGRKYKTVQINLDNPQDCGEFMGIFAGDGCFYKRKDTGHYNIRFYN